MDIYFQTNKLKKTFNEGARLDALHGKLRATKIRNRMAEFRAANSLMDFWPPKSGPSRCHELTGGRRAGQLSVDLDHPYRLLFVPFHNPRPLRPDGSLDWAKVTAITIIGVEDTHG